MKYDNRLWEDDKVDQSKVFSRLLCGCGAILKVEFYKTNCLINQKVVPYHNSSYVKYMYTL